jgi:hypothetical protein
MPRCRGRPSPLPLDSDRHQYRTGRHWPPCSDQRIRGMANRR